MIVASLKEIVLAKFRRALCFELQSGETTDISILTKLINYLRFPDTECFKIVDH